MSNDQMVLVTLLRTPSGHAHAVASGRPIALDELSQQRARAIAAGTKVYVMLTSVTGLLLRGRIVGRVVT